MASALLKAAFLVLFACTAAHAMTYYDYNANRTEIGKLADGVELNYNALHYHLYHTGLSETADRARVRSLAKMIVFGKSEETLSTLIRDEIIILDELLEDVCDYLKDEGFVATNSDCTLNEMRRLLTLLDLFFVHEEIRDNPAINAANTNTHCFCSWARENVVPQSCVQSDGEAFTAATGQCATICSPQSPGFTAGCFTGLTG